MLRGMNAHDLLTALTAGVGLLTTILVLRRLFAR